MKKRVTVGLLWFYVTWYVWTMLAQVAGLTELAGPVLGAIVAALVAGDPMHRIWTRAARSTESVDSATTAVREPA